MQLHLPWDVKEGGVEGPGKSEWQRTSFLATFCNGSLHWSNIHQTQQCVHNTVQRWEGTHQAPRKLMAKWCCPVAWRMFPGLWEELIWEVSDNLNNKNITFYNCIIILIINIYWCLLWGRHNFKRFVEIDWVDPILVQIDYYYNIHLTDKKRSPGEVMQFA